MINLFLSQTIFAQEIQVASADKITPHEPQILLEEKKDVDVDSERSWFSKYGWWILAGVVVTGGIAAAAGGGGGGSPSTENPSNGGTGTGTDTGNISLNW